MTASMLTRGRLLGVIAATAIAVGCMQDSAGEPRRPPAVPARATWVGGPDGGVFVVLRATTATTYAGTVYYPDGSIWYAGTFVLRPLGARAFDPARAKQLSGWDGTKLLIDDGRTLEASPAAPGK